MAIRFDKNFNEKIYREVRNFNRRRNDAKKAGVKGLPDTISTRELKRRFDKRKDLEKELSLIRSYRRTNLTDVELSGGAKVSNWDLEHIKNNLNQAKKYYEREEKILSERIGRFPSEQDRLNTIRANKTALESNLKNLDQLQFDDIKGAINTFIRSRNKWGTGYRGFLSEVEEVMARTGVPIEARNEFFKKFQKLNQEEFFYLYESSDLIKRIYALIDSPKLTNKMNASVKDARGYVDDLMSQVDLMIEEAKKQ